MDKKQRPSVQVFGRKVSAINGIIIVFIINIARKQLQLLLTVSRAMVL